MPVIGPSPGKTEKTPSFTVSPTKGIYKCFGCGEGGNSVSFLMDKEHYTYPEALKYLAKKYNIEIVEEEMTFEANRLIVECPGADDYEWEVKDALGELVFTSKGDSCETYLITDLPEDIVDYQFNTGVGDLHDEALNSIEEAVDIIKNLKTISFKEINPKDGENIRYIN